MSINKEAKVFSDRINNRVQNGFNPDLRNLNYCEYFYKSFWRHPHFANLFVGKMSKFFVSQFKKNLNTNSKILDLGCGPGYFSLELARAGFDVVAVDISEGAISQAKNVLKKLKKEKLKLRYSVRSDLEINSFNKFDGVLCSGILHHLKNLNEAVSLIHNALKKNGIVVMHEPQHLKWNKKDAYTVMLIRNLLNLTNYWYEKDLKTTSKREIQNQVNEIFNEFIYERDKNEKEGQSPNDLENDRDEILNNFKYKFIKLYDKPSFSFIYRLLGGLRGEEKKIKEIASFLSVIDKFGIENRILNANYFYATFLKK